MKVSLKGILPGISVTKNSPRARSGIIRWKMRFAPLYMLRSGYAGARKKAMTAKVRNTADTEVSLKVEGMVFLDISVRNDTAMQKMFESTVKYFRFARPLVSSQSR